MIVSNILNNLFYNLEISYNEYKQDRTKKGIVTKPLKFHFGDQLELNRWLLNRRNKDNYPLVWYVMDSYKENGKNIICNVRLMIFTSTKSEYYNNERSFINYVEILNPIYDLLREHLVSTNYLYAKNFIIRDIPNYGVKTDINPKNQSSDFNSTEKKGTQNITIDIVDCKQIDFYLEVINYKKIC